MSVKSKKAIIIGAGPAGLACAYELLKLDANIKPIIIEKSDCVGGLSRTIYEDGLGFDIGGHRFYTKDKYIKSIWDEFLTVQNYPAIDDLYCGRYVEYPKNGKNPDIDDNIMLIRKKFSSVLLNYKYFSYPIKLELETIKKLGLLTTISAFLSYIKSQIFKRKEKSFEDFLINQFGVVLYNIFFREFSMKIWGKYPSSLSCHLGSERVRNTPFLKMIFNAIFSKFKFQFLNEANANDQFFYPKYGSSQLWSLMMNYIKQNGGEFIFDADVFDFIVNDNKMIDLKYREKNGTVNEIKGDYFVSSMPINQLVKGLDLPLEIENHAQKLKFRDCILVSFYVNAFNLKNYTNFNTVNNITPDSWVYFLDNNSISSRMQIINNWSPYLIPDFKRNFLITMEYYSTKGDTLSNMDDNRLLELALNECKKFNFFSKKDVISSKVIREPNAFPVYDEACDNLDKIKKKLANIKNLYLIGRNGQYKCVNMDEAMKSGINVARIIDKVENYE